MAGLRLVSLAGLLGFLLLFRLVIFVARRSTGRPMPRLRVVPFIATLGMLGVARGTAKWFANEQTVNVPQTWINQLLVTFPSPPWLLLAPGV